MIRGVKWSFISAFFAVAICGIILAEDTPTKLKWGIDFVKSIGFYNYFESEDIPIDAATDISNIDFVKSGVLQMRGGVPKYTTITGVTAPYNYNTLSIWTSITGNRYFVSRIGSRIHTTPIATGGFNNQFSAQPVLGNVDGVNWNGIYYIIQESTGLVRIDEVTPNTTITYSYLSTGTPGAMFAQAHRSRLLLAGSTQSAYANTIFYSDQDNPESFPAGNTMTLPFERNGQRITGLGPPVLNVIPIYTDGSTYEIIGTVFPSLTFAGNVDLRLVSKTVGAIHGRTAKNVGNGQYVFSRGPNFSAPGIYAFNGTSMKEVTKPIRKYFEKSVNLSTTPTPSAFVYGDKYCLSVATPGGVGLSQTICINSSENKIEINNLSIDDFASNGSERYAINGIHNAADPNVNDIFTYDSGDLDYNGPVTWRYKTKDYNMGDAIRANPKRAEVAYICYMNKPGTFTVTANWDLGRGSATWIINQSTLTWEGSYQTIVYSSTANIVAKLLFPEDARGNYYNFELSGSSRSVIHWIDFYATAEALR